MLQQRALKNLRVAMLREAIDPITEGSKETLKLVNLQPYVYKLLDTSGLAGSFEMLDSLDNAAGGARRPAADKTWPAACSRRGTTPSAFTGSCPTYWSAVTFAGYGRCFPVRSRNRRIPIASVSISRSWKSQTSCRLFSVSKNATEALTLFFRYFPYGP